MEIGFFGGNKMPRERDKFSSPWEGPYRVVHVLKPGVLRLEMEEGKPVNNSWNIEHLWKYHFPEVLSVRRWQSGSAPRYVSA